jgi:excisionase family DNA binding protein
VLPDPSTQPTLSVPEAGALLGLLSRGAAYKAAKEGTIPTLRFGRRLRVPTAAVLSMLGVSAEAA